MYKPNNSPGLFEDCWNCRLLWRPFWLGSESLKRDEIDHFPEPHPPQAHDSSVAGLKSWKLEAYRDSQDSLFRCIYHFTLEISFLAMQAGTKHSRKSLNSKNLPFWHQEKQPKEFVQSWQVPFKFRSKFLFWVSTHGNPGAQFEDHSENSHEHRRCFWPIITSNEVSLPGLPTLADPFLDPLAKWIRHVLVHVMIMCDRHPLLAQVLLREISKINVPKSSACNGFRNAMYIRSNSMEGPFPGWL